MENNNNKVFAYFVAGLTVSSVTTLLLFHLFDITRKKKDGIVDRVKLPPPEEGTKAVFKPATSSAGVSLQQTSSSKKSANEYQSYRFEEENIRTLSSEYTRRGSLWSRHASWQLPRVPRSDSSRHQIESYYLGNQGLDRILDIFKKYGVDMISGFLPPKDPLQRLPYARYHLWEDLGDDLPKLLGARLGQARDPLGQLPVLATDKLITDAELRRAHLLLCLFAHAYVWGGTSPIDRIPEGIAKPLWEVSQRLGIPPVLGHPSIVLYNWRRLDAKGEICMENLATLNNFFDGRDESWFYLITVEIEARGARAIVPTMLAVDAIQRYNDEVALKTSSETAGEKRNAMPATISYRVGHRCNTHDDEDCDSGNEDAHCCDQNNDGEAQLETIYTNEALVGVLSRWRVAVFVTAQLKVVSEAIDGMTASILNMREGCHPFIFYHRVRPFLSAWKHNPAMPNGVIYEGVSETPMQFYGGSAAQSSLLPFLDIALGVSHDSNKSRDFLMAMRDYMIQPHREFLVYFESICNLRAFVTEQVALIAEDSSSNDNNKSLSSQEVQIIEQLRDAYDAAVKSLQAFRSGHINIVAEFIVAQQRNALPKGGSLEGSAGGRGTGGTELMSFLKPIRDDVVNRIIKEEDRSQAHAVKDSEEGAGVSTIEVLRQETVATADLVATKSTAKNVTSTPSTSSSASKPRGVSSDVYYKDNGRAEDIDLFHRSGSSTSLVTQGNASASATTAESAST